jgi:cysteine desulfuration protein SufE
METMGVIPPKLAEMVELFDSLTDRAERVEVLISLSERFERVPESIAAKPYPEEHRVPGCESEAYVWALPSDGGTLKYYFAVENPQGISAMATAVILDETCSGASPAQVAAIPRDIIYRFFGKELSMGKSMGLMGIIDLVKKFAREALSR